MSFHRWGMTRAAIGLTLVALWAAGANDAQGAAPAPAAPAAAAAPAPAAAPADAAPAASSDGDYQVRLRELERRVSALKEQIFRSKARLTLLKESVLGGAIGGARAVIVHQNEMGGAFKLVKAAYALDGTQIFARTDDTGKLDADRSFEIFNGSIVPGNHTMSVMLVFRGDGHGLFSYLQAYKFTVRSSHTFSADDGRITEVVVRAYERGNAFTTQLKDRPAIEYKVNVHTERGESAPQAAR